MYFVLLTFIWDCHWPLLIFIFSVSTEHSFAQLSISSCLPPLASKIVIVISFLPDSPVIATGLSPFIFFQEGRLQLRRTISWLLSRCNLGKEKRVWDACWGLLFMLLFFPRGWIYFYETWFNLLNFWFWWENAFFPEWVCCYARCCWNFDWRKTAFYQENHVKNQVVPEWLRKYFWMDRYLWFFRNSKRGFHTLFCFFSWKWVHW